MSQISGPQIFPRGLSTVAFLTAQLDERKDYLDIFIPLIADVINNALLTDSFTSEQVQEELRAQHGLAMPLDTIRTLLNRAVSEKLVEREHGRYKATKNIVRQHSIREYQSDGA